MEHCGRAGVEAGFEDGGGGVDPEDEVAVGGGGALGGVELGGGEGAVGGVVDLQGAEDFAAVVGVPFGGYGGVDLGEVGVEFGGVGDRKSVV